MAGEFPNAIAPHKHTMAMTSGGDAGRSSHRIHSASIEAMMVPIPISNVRSAPRESVAMPPHQIPIIPAKPEKLNEMARAVMSLVVVALR